MKKERKLSRTIALLLLLTVIALTLVAGTYAKYVTTVSGTDTARVAKWGIVMDGDGTSTFVDKYDSTVESADRKAVVAPGTSGSSTYTVSGAPETDYVVSFSATDIKDIYLGAGTYTYTNDDNTIEYAASMSQTVTTTYYPIEYYVTLNTTAGTVSGSITPNQKSSAYSTLEAALTALEGTTIAYDANEECDAEVVIDWEWKFEHKDASNNVIAVDDAYDTILGDLMAGSDSDLTASTDADYNLNVAYTLTMTATQVD